MHKSTAKCWQEPLLEQTSYKSGMWTISRPGTSLTDISWRTDFRLTLPSTEISLTDTSPTGLLQQDALISPSGHLYDQRR